MHDVIGSTFPGEHARDENSGLDESTPTVDNVKGSNTTLLSRPPPANHRSTRSPVAASKMEDNNVPLKALANKLPSNPITL
ncbi:MAG TPA: hypothetical protein VLG28_13390 [Acidimicrobiia bacterium]|nr:hypothetical protein [Acidimicrobiia bacterium]